MTMEVGMTADAAMEEAVGHLRETGEAKKCWPCGCLHNGLADIERAFPDGTRPVELEAVIRTARERLIEVRYDCLGCDVCYPAAAIGALSRAGGRFQVDVETCPSATVQEREGWPPLPGAYTVLRYGAPAAVCTLTDERLAAAVADQPDPGLAIVGTLQTENLGIERLILNVLANPNIQFLVVCGADSRQAIGHLPGQSLVALARSGLDERSRIVGAAGKRPVLRNLSREAVEHFRRTVEVVDLVGEDQVPAVQEAVRRCAARNPGPAEPFTPERLVTSLQGYLPERMTSDPAGYFVLYVDRPRRILSLEHYRNEGVLDTVIEGRTAPELYCPAVEKGLVSRLDHAAYLGRELARAEQALRSGEPFIQDAAPEAPATHPVKAACGCDSHAKEGET
jgi:tetrahydromethanopterin S-methyltransferase subunit A